MTACRDGLVLLEMPKGQRFTFTIEPDLYEPLRMQAKKERRSIGSLLNFLASKYLEDQQGLEIEATIQHGGDRKSTQAQEGTAE
ncbi:MULTISPECIES: hypothetical protein [Leptolyngbya]|uniref:hypothetical protein n=1 Tax=Leptolyngbya TaxID=47251 RepID=UPI00168713E3|nr:hypothetical protein [Leptolyngbya sp. FACHB-1624]MBD1857432.1 hypothetical protein [Leptolyngbya sp. FACHB-1624]